MKKQSAGVLMYRFISGQIQFLLVHPGGPFWAKKDTGVWSIPKGEFEDEDPKEAAKREFLEETGAEIKGELVQLTPQIQKSGKVIYCWAVQGDFDTSKLKSNTFEMEWPPKSGKLQEFPEVDRAEWFVLEEALLKINPGQAGFIREAVDRQSR